MNKTYPFPPDLLNLLIQTIPLLIKSKKGVLDFFAGAGVRSLFLDDLDQRLREEPEQVNKYFLARTVLIRLSEAGDSAIAEWREVLRRVVEWHDFSTCYPDKQLEARGLVAQIREVQNVKDSFTRMNLERENERKERQAVSRSQQEAEQRRRDKLEVLKKDYYSLFSMKNPHQRGKKLEDVLNRLFALDDILVREAFTLVGSQGEGIVEQIDGVVEFDGRVYLVEMKWWNDPIGRTEISPHLVKVYHRAETHGIFISASGYTSAAIDVSREALQQRIYFLCTLKEIVMLLEQEKSLKKDYLQKKVNMALSLKNPFYDPLS